MINDAVRISGNIQDASRITGRLAAADGINGCLSCVSAVTGTLSGASRIEGGLSAGAIRGAVSVPETLGGDYYDGDYVITPKAGEGTVLGTAGLTMRDDVTVLRIPYYETSNPKGYTVYIGGEV